MTSLMDRRPQLRMPQKQSHAPIAATDFAASMRMLASGVVIVTSFVDDRPWGVTLSSLSSFSADPARIAFSIVKSTATAQSIVGRGAFGVAILPSSAAGLAAQQAAPGQAKFLPDADVAGHGAVLGAPLVAGALYNLECRSVVEVEVHDHLLVVADVVSATAGCEEELGLVYWNRALGSFAHPEGELA